MKKKRLLLSSLFLLSSLAIASCTGPQGEKGDKGDQGEQGIQGEPGENGEDGEDGSQWYTGEGVPSTDLGKEGDMYLNTSTNDIYQKETSGWVLKSNIQGDPGEDGEDGENGRPGSSGSNGKTAWSNTILPSTGGYITVDKGSAIENEEITFSIYPNTDYELHSFTLDGEVPTEAIIYDASGVGSLTTKMKKNGFVVAAEFRPVSESGSQEVYFEDGVMYSNGRVDGLGNVISEGTPSEIKFEGGNGKDEPLQIKTAEQFNYLNEIPSYLENGVSYDEQPSYNFELLDDITISEPVGYFNGVLNGNGNKLTVETGKGGSGDYSLILSAYGDVELKNLDIELTQEDAISLIYYTFGTTNEGNTYTLDNVLFEDINISAPNGQTILVDQSNFGFLTHNALYISPSTGKEVNCEVRNVHINADVISSSTTSSPFLGYGPMLANENVSVTYENCSYRGTFRGNDQVGLLWSNASGTTQCDLDTFKNLVNVKDVYNYGNLYGKDTCNVIPHQEEFSSYLLDNGYVINEGSFAIGDKLTDANATGSLLYNPSTGSFGYKLNNYELVEGEKIRLVLSVDAIHHSQAVSNGRHLYIDDAVKVSDEDSNYIELSTSNSKAYTESSFKEAHSSYNQELVFDHKIEAWDVAIVYADNELCLIFKDSQVESANGVHGHIYLNSAEDAVLGSIRVF